VSTITNFSWAAGK